MLAKGQKVTQSLHASSCGDHECVLPDFTAIHPIVVSIFHSESECWILLVRREREIHNLPFLTLTKEEKQFRGPGAVQAVTPSGAEIKCY